MSIDIMRIASQSDQQAFLQLQQAVYTTDPLHIPQCETFPSTGTAYIACDGNKPIARCNTCLQTDHPTTGTIGAFEALNHPPAVKLLLETAIEGLKSLGAQRIIGPMDGDTWHHYRFNTGPFNNPPFIKEPWNPPYYPALWEAAGFKVTETYDTFIVDDPAAAAANQKRYHDRCVKLGHTFVPVTARNFEEKLPLLHELSCRIFDGNVLYTSVGLDEFKRMYLPAKPLFKPGLSWLALAPDGTPEGYIFTFPDYANAIRSMNGKDNMAAKLRFIMNKRNTTRTCIKTLGTIPEKRRSGVSAALTYLSYHHSARQGYRKTLMCLMHSANASRRFGGEADQPYRSYALYEYSA